MQLLTASRMGMQTGDVKSGDQLRGAVFAAAINNNNFVACSLPAQTSKSDGRFSASLSVGMMTEIMAPTCSPLMGSF